MRVTCQPSIDQWVIGGSTGSPSNRNAGTPSLSRRSLCRAVSQNAERLGSPTLTPGLPIIATGHQATLWHPGILAKDLAAHHAAQTHHAQTLHLVVDQDDVNPLAIQVPIRRGHRLDVEPIQLASVQPGVPPSCQPPVDPSQVQQTCTAMHDKHGDDLPITFDPIAASFQDTQHAATLAEQVTIVLNKLREPHTRTMPLLLASQLAALREFDIVLQQMLSDPHECITHYNAAAAQHPQASIGPLMKTEQRVELPLWWLQWGQPRQRVYADMSQAKPVLCLANAEPLQLTNGDTGLITSSPGRLAPRALLQTALMRRAWCDFFIHGTGGAHYDRVTDTWWSQWTGEKLALYAGVSADVTLNFDVPVSDHDALANAVWWAHHLPHNVDRSLGLNTPPTALVLEKRELIEHMHDDNDRRRRAAAFARIHQINRQLTTEHPDLIANARRAVSTAQDGVANRRIALKRDWCFAFYDDDALRALSEQFTYFRSR